MSSLDKYLSRGYNSAMTKEQKLALKKYERILKANAETQRRWRKAHPEYELSPARREYKRVWAQVRRQNARVSDVNNSLQA